MHSLDPSVSSICNPPGSRLFIVCGRSVEGTLGFQPTAGLPVRANGASKICFFAESTLQAAFAPFGTIQNIKLIKEKGVSAQAGAAAAYWLTGTSLWPRFKRAAAQGSLSVLHDGRFHHTLQ